MGDDSMVDNAREKAEELKDKTADKAEEWKDKAEDLVEDDQEDGPETGSRDTNAVTGQPRHP